MPAAHVLPEPVTPISVWFFFPRRRPSTSFSIAWGWSPAGANALWSWNVAMDDLASRGPIDPGRPHYSPRPDGCQRQSGRPGAI
jgi:hypothetical protein